MTVTIEEVRRREKYWSDHWRAQQNRDKLAFFPSTLAGDRGATSPLGGQAVPATPSKELKR